MSLSLAEIDKLYCAKFGFGAQLLTWCVPGSTYCVRIGMSLEPQEIPILYITVAYAEIFKGGFGYVN